MNTMNLIDRDCVANAVRNHHVNHVDRTPWMEDVETQLLELGARVTRATLYENRPRRPFSIGIVRLSRKETQTL